VGLWEEGEGWAVVGSEVKRRRGRGGGSVRRERVVVLVLRGREGYELRVVRAQGGRQLDSEYQHEEVRRAFVFISSC
jgi:hypothetical protein